MGHKEKFIGVNFKQSYLISNYENAINFDYYYNIIQPNIVLFETVEYAITKGYYPEKRIKNRIYNEAYEKFADLPEGSIENIDNNKIKESVQSQIKESNENDSKSPLTKITIPKNNYKFAYLVVNDKAYDFCNDGSNEYLSIDKEIINNNEFKIVFIDEKMETKHTVNFN
ncbi:MAG: hypothetical protein IKP28_04155 [Clostridia bacterium]|nr:hypothetical protein [Clostridia bacterium]